MGMAKKNSSKLVSFNRTQEIYKLLEKGIIESEALMNGSVDRPEDDAHLSDLLSSTSKITHPVRTKQIHKTKHKTTKNKKHSKPKPRKRK